MCIKNAENKEYYTNERGGGRHEFDLYLIFAASSWKTVQKSIPSIKKNIKFKRILLVSSEKLLGEDLLGCEFLNENEILQGLTYSAVKDFLKKLGSCEENTGWYLQQFIKLGISRICADDFYLVWDGDTIPLNPIEFFDKNGKPFFNLKREYFSAYFRTIESLFGIKKTRRESFISEHMLFNSEIAREMLAKIEEMSEIGGEKFWQKILVASDLHHFDIIKDDERFFSEFETFGTYAEHFYPNLYATRKLRTLRHGTDFLGSNPSKDVLEWAAKDFDTISFENWGTPIPEMVALSEDSGHREQMSFADTLRHFFKSERRKIFAKFPRINHEQFRHFFENTIAKTNFDFFFSKKCGYSKRNPYFEDSLLQHFKFLYVTKCRIQRYWRLLTFHF